MQKEYHRHLRRVTTLWGTVINKGHDDSINITITIIITG